MELPADLRSPRRIARLAADYGLPALLGLVLLLELLGGAVFGDDPRPQIPPHGYLAHEDRVTLSWRRGDHQGSFRVQVAEAGQGFDAPVIDRTLGATRLTLPALDPGRRYCWRVLAESGATVTCFRTAPAYVAY
jgi:hypothetical protein